MIPSQTTSSVAVSRAVSTAVSTASSQAQSSASQGLQSLAVSQAASTLSSSQSSSTAPTTVTTSITTSITSTPPLNNAENFPPLPNQPQVKQNLLLSKFLSKETMTRNLKTSTLQNPLPPVTEATEEPEDLSAIHSPSQGLLDASTFIMEEDPYADFAQPTSTPTKRTLADTSTTSEVPSLRQSTSNLLNTLIDAAASNSKILDTLIEANDDIGNNNAQNNDLSSTGTRLDFTKCSDVPCVHEAQPCQSPCSLQSDCTFCRAGFAQDPMYGFPGQAEIDARIQAGLDESLDGTTSQDRIIDSDSAHDSPTSVDSALGSPSRGSSQDAPITDSSRDAPIADSSSSFQFGDRDNEPGTILSQIGLLPGDSGNKNLSVVETKSLSAVVDKIKFVDVNATIQNDDEYNNTSASSEELNTTVVYNEINKTVDRKEQNEQIEVIVFDQKIIRKNSQIGSPT